MSPPSDEVFNHEVTARQKNLFATFDEYTDFYVKTLEAKGYDVTEVKKRVQQAKAAINDIEVMYDPRDPDFLVEQLDGSISQALDAVNVLEDVLADPASVEAATSIRMHLDIASGEIFGIS